MVDIKFELEWKKEMMSYFLKRYEKWDTLSETNVNWARDQVDRLWSYWLKKGLNCSN